VRFFYLTFGIGIVRTYIGETFVDLPVNGAAGHPAVAGIDWETPAAAGHYCLQAELVWPDDANPDNNLGQENVVVKKLNSPKATFVFPVRNDSPFARTVQLVADSYAVPRQPPCDSPDEPRDATRLKGRVIPNNERAGQHRYGAYPIPAGWTIAFLPAAELQMQPGETRTVTVEITTTDAPVARQAINVNAFAEGAHVGGLTLYVHS
jgi:hypothetical protein